jgi:hypothetical protein
MERYLFSMRTPGLSARAIAVVVAVFVATGLGGCSEPARHGEAPIARVALPLCEAACDRRDRCGDDSACACVAAHDTGAIRADWAEAAAACARDAPCGADVDCDVEAARAIGVRPLDQPAVVLRCLSKGDVCGGSFAACRRLAALTDDARAEVDRCAPLPCDAWHECFASFWSREVAPAVPAWR